jgi:RNA polymerase sigma factor (sigma-70 family)
MDEAERQFDELMQRVRAGCPQAAEEIYHRYSEAVRRVVHCRLEVRMRREYDSVDLAQSVWASFFHISPDNYTFDSPADLVAFLSRVAENKVIDARRKRFGTQRRGQGQEQSLDAPFSPDVPVPLGEVLPGHAHTPSQFLMADECWEKCLRSRPREDRLILELLREGYADAEIADRLGIYRKKVQRLRDYLSEFLDQS